MENKNQAVSSIEKKGEPSAFEFSQEESRKKKVQKIILIV